LHRAAAVAGFPDNFNILLLGEKMADARADNVVIVGNQDQRLS